MRTRKGNTYKVLRTERHHSKDSISVCAHMHMDVYEHVSDACETRDAMVLRLAEPNLSPQ